MEVKYDSSKEIGQIFENLSKVIKKLERKDSKIKEFKKIKD